MAALSRAAFSQSPHTLSVRADNDAFDFWMQPYNRPDEEYTSGVHVALDGGGAPWWSRGLMRNGGACVVHATRCRTGRLEIGQDIYTPSTSLDSPTAAATSRPNAGWLYLSQAARLLAPTRSDELSLTLGVTGSPSLAQQMQRFFHSLAPEFNRPTDWSRQIAFEPGVIARYEQQRRILVGDVGSVGFDVLPRFAASVGNVSDAAEAEVRARAGWHLPHPWLPSSDAFSATLFTGAGGRGVARDLFLDGSTFGSGPRVGHEPFVGFGELGVSVQAGVLTLAYRAVSETRSYSTGPKWHPWASMVAGVTFSR